MDEADRIIERHINIIYPKVMLSTENISIGKPLSEIIIRQLLRQGFIEGLVASSRYTDAALNLLRKVNSH